MPSPKSHSFERPRNLPRRHRLPRPPHPAGASALAIPGPVLGGDKATDYRRIESLQEYPLTAQDRVRVERYRRAGNNEWLLSEFSSLAIDLPVAALYAGVPLEPSPRR